MKMKTSNKILLVVGLIPVLIIILMLLALRIMPGDASKKIVSPTGAQVSKTIDLKDFNKISIKGVWTIHIIQGNDYKVEINAPEKNIDKIIVEKREGALVINDNLEGLGSSGEKNQETTITIPVLDEIDLNGVSNLDLKGGKYDTLSIRIEGVTRITGSDGTIRDLAIGGNGVLTIDLSGISATNATVEYDGVHNINLLMNGGRLSGRLTGIGSLNYQGDVSLNELRVDGPLSKVVHQTR